MALEPPLLPYWQDIFESEGSLRDQVDEIEALGSNGVPNAADLYGGLDPVFTGDNLSDGIAIDMSALVTAEALSDHLVYNGTVDGSNDIGNTYVLAAQDGDGNLVLYAGIERLTTTAESYIDLEFNQDVVQVRQGDPWPLHGSRTANDILIRLNLAEGAISSVEFRRWDESGAFETIDQAGSLSHGACRGAGTRYVVCIGSPPIESTEVELWDADGAPVGYLPPDSFVEIGINVDVLLGTAHPDFTSIQVRTPGDISLNVFKNIGLWGAAAATASK